MGSGQSGRVPAPTLPDATCLLFLQLLLAHSLVPWCEHGVGGLGEGSVTTSMVPTKAWAEGQ